MSPLHPREGILGLSYRRIRAVTRFDGLPALLRLLTRPLGPREERAEHPSVQYTDQQPATKTIIVRRASLMRYCGADESCTGSS